MNIESFLVSEIFAFMLIFTRVGSGVMVLPGIGEGYVSARVRLVFALIASLAMMPALSPLMPTIPGSPLALIVIIASEVLTGLFFGLMARILLSTMHTVGMILSYQSSLATATMFDSSQAGQGTAIGNFLGMLALVLLFITDLHHLMLRGLYDSYALFPPGNFAPVGDFAEVMSRLVGDTFVVAMKMASPLIAIGLLSYISSGVLSRLMPNMQVFFVIVPPQIWLSFAIISMVLSGMMLWYMEYLENYLSQYIG
jgi:flagellar biosynthetic protein FliR